MGIRTRAVSRWPMRAMRAVRATRARRRCDGSDDPKQGEERQDTYKHTHPAGLQARGRRAWSLSEVTAAQRDPEPERP
jgi:hypothetical protein